MRTFRLIRSYVAPLIRCRHNDVSSPHSSSSTNGSSVNGISKNLQDDRQSTPVAAVANADDDGFSFSQPEFDNTALIYASKSTAELLRAYLVFGACSLDVLVNNQTKLLRWLRVICGRWLYEQLVGKTVFAQFMAKSHDNDIMAAVRRLIAADITPMFAYTASEFHGVNIDQHGVNRVVTSSKMKWFENNLHHIRRSIDVAAKCIDISPASPCITTKLTFFEDAKLLEMVSDVITQQTRIVSEALDGLNNGWNEAVEHLLSPSPPADTMSSDQVHSLIKQFQPIPSTHRNSTTCLSLCTSLQFHLSLNFSSRLPTTALDGLKLLTTSQVERLLLLWQRMNAINEYASEQCVVVNYDAEQYSIQPAIDTLVLDSMRCFNHASANVLNTYQCYLKRASGLVRQHIQLTQSEGFSFGAKIVRGAYLDEERRTAERLQYACPVHDTYDDTTSAYHDVTCQSLNCVKSRPLGTSRLLLATHNRQTVDYVIQQLKARQLNPNKANVMFVQLLGTRDFISYALGEANYPAAKLIHFGDVVEGVTFLSRRLLENRSGFPGPTVERQLLATELANRITRQSR